MRKIAVCSWSLQSTSADELVRQLQVAGLSRVQLALDPLRTGDWPEGPTLAALQIAGIEVVSGMISMQGEDYTTLETIRETGGVRLDAPWEANLAGAEACAKIARRFGLSLVSFHAGFLPDDRDDPERGKLIGRLRQLVDIFAAEQVKLVFETGQETADTLVGFLEELDREASGVNFDPANMILYGKGDPVAALDRLAPWVRQVHIKDARSAATPGTWGEEMPAGTGEVDWSAFFDLLVTHHLPIDLVIEREGGDDRIGDIARARQMIEQQLQRIGG
jgi:L-ribulose-5-phosphate 3-epimerase